METVKEYALNTTGLSEAQIQAAHAFWQWWDSMENPADSIPGRYFPVVKAAFAHGWAMAKAQNP